MVEVDELVLLALLQDEPAEGDPSGSPGTVRRD